VSFIGSSIRTPYVGNRGSPPSIFCGFRPSVAASRTPCPFHPCETLFRVNIVCIQLQKSASVAAMQLNRTKSPHSKATKQAKFG
jgi:hypothetical protein